MGTLPPPVRMDHSLWVKGVNTAGGSMRSLRILMLLGLAVDILEHADMDQFVDSAGAVVCPVDVLRFPDDAVWLLKKEPQRLRLRDVDRNVHCKVLELPLNFETSMLRCQFRTLPKPRSASSAADQRGEWLARSRAYLDAWVELLIAEKRRQMNIEEANMWPSWLPWQVHGVYSMPIVLWLSKASKRH